MPDVAIGLAEAGTSHFLTILGRTDIRIGVSEAKFDLKDDFDVKNSFAPPKSAENHEKQLQNKFENKLFVDFFFDSESFETRFGEVLQVKHCEKLTKNCENSAKISQKSANRLFTFSLNYENVIYECFCFGICMEVLSVN